jgi:hypothetical protein
MLAKTGLRTSRILLAQVLVVLATSGKARFEVVAESYCACCLLGFFGALAESEARNERRQDKKDVALLVWQY